MKSSDTDIAAGNISRRILAFDLLRGIFLLVILIDHVELYPSFFDFLTGKGRLWVSAAEGFFFISGLLIGMVYKRRLHKGMKFIFLKIWQRGAELYIASAVLTFLFVAWALWANDPYLKDGLPLPFHWPHIIFETFLMRFGFGWADFLARFAILMIFAPFVFYLTAKGRWKLVILISLVVWAFRGQTFTLGWQLLFNSGIVIGFNWYTIQEKYRQLSPKRRALTKRFFFITAAVTFVFSYVSIYLLNIFNYLWGLDYAPPTLIGVTGAWNHVNYDIWQFDQKWNLGPVRLALFFVWFPVLFYLINKYGEAINRRTRGIIELMGQNSLFVYVAHAFIIFILKLYVIPPGTVYWQNFLITAVALVLLISVTVGYARLRHHVNQKYNSSILKLIQKKGRLLFAG